VNRTISVTNNPVTLDWTTSEAATGQVNYGLALPYTASSTMETTASTTHSVTITGLTASTTYHYEITATDAAGNTGTTGDLVFTTSASPVVGLPVISSITVTPATSTAMIQWNTDTAATSQVFYGTTTPYTASTTLNSTMSTSHSVTLTGLTASTTYHYQIQSTNSAGTTSFEDRTFTTNALPGSTPVLAVTGVDAVNTIALPDGTYANGFKWVLHFTVPDTETSFALKFNNFTSPTASTVIPVAGNLRYYSAQSTNASTTASAVTETNNDYGTALNLTGDTSSTTPGRQIDVTVELKVPTGTESGVYSTLFGARSL
jgi:hypothetical protein